MSTTDGRVKLDLDLLANAILEGVDGIFLATGSVVDMNELVKVIEDVDLVCREAESARWQRQIFHELSYKVLNMFIIYFMMISSVFGQVKKKIK